MHVAAVQPASAPSRGLPPLLAPLLARRWFCAYLAIFGAVHLVLRSVGLLSVGCVIRQATGVPCPGCGLTHACLDFLAGHWSEGFALHPFAPIFLLLLGLFGTAALLPTAARLALAGQVGAFERHTGIAALLAIALLLNWWLRLP